MVLYICAHCTFAILPTYVPVGQLHCPHIRSPSPLQTSASMVWERERKRERGKGREEGKGERGSVRGRGGGEIREKEEGERRRREGEREREREREMRGRVGGGVRGRGRGGEGKGGEGGVFADQQLQQLHTCISFVPASGALCVVLRVMSPNSTAFIHVCTCTYILQ